MLTILPPSAPSGLDTRNPAYQALKGRVHKELLNRLNLERLTKVNRAEAEPEIAELIIGLLERETRQTPLSLLERESARASTSSTSSSASGRSRRC